MPGVGREALPGWALGLLGVFGFRVFGFRVFEGIGFRVQAFWV